MNVTVLYTTARGPQTDVLENGREFTVDEKNNLHVYTDDPESNGQAMYAAGVWTSAMLVEDDDE